VSGTWARREAGGGAGDAATVSGSEAQLGQTAATWEARWSQREGGKRRGRGRGDTCTGAEGCRSGRDGAHGRGRATAARGRETERRERQVDEGGPKCNFREMQGPYCKA
jgi:hypothetical protein